MARYSSEESGSEAACERCGAELTDEHWVRLRAVHRGRSADRYADSEVRICVDCLAAMGMLDLDACTGSEGRVRERLDSIRNSIGS